MTWGELLNQGQRKLLSAFEDETAAVVFQEARLLLAWASGRSTAWLLSHLDDKIGSPDVTERQTIAERFIAAVSRRALREPAAYVTGWAGFCGQVFEVNPHVLIPRPDTELLVGVVSGFLDELAGMPEKQAKPQAGGIHDTDAHFTRILDIGTGSGCISCILALKHGNIGMDAVDLSSEALEVACRNAERMGVSDRICFFKVDVLSDDFVRILANPMPDIMPPVTGECAPSFVRPFSFMPESRYDVVVSNPPYIPSADLAGLMPDVFRFEPHAALDGGPDGLLFHRRLLRVSKDILKPGGLLAVEIGYDQGVTVPDLFRETGFVPTVHFDLGGNPRVVTGLFVHGA